MFKSIRTFFESGIRETDIDELAGITDIRDEPTWVAVAVFADLGSDLRWLVRVKRFGKLLVAIARHESVSLGFKGCLTDSRNELVNVVFLVRQCQQARTVVPNVHPSAANAGEKDLAVDQFLMKLDLEKRTEISEPHWRVEFLKHFIQFVGQII